MKKPEITIMSETSAGVDAVTTVTMAAFEGVAISNKIPGVPSEVFFVLPQPRRQQ